MITSSVITSTQSNFSNQSVVILNTDYCYLVEKGKHFFLPVSLFYSYYVYHLIQYLKKCLKIRRAYVV